VETNVYTKRATPDADLQAVQLDVVDQESVDEAVNTVSGLTGGRLDLLVNNVRFCVGGCFTLIHILIRGIVTPDPELFPNQPRSPCPWVALPPPFFGREGPTGSPSGCSFGSPQSGLSNSNPRPESSRKDPC